MPFSCSETFAGEIPVCIVHYENKIFSVFLKYPIWTDQRVCVCVCVYSGLTSLSTIFQSYHDGVWLRQGMLTFIVLPH